MGNKTAAVLCKAKSICPLNCHTVGTGLARAVRLIVLAVIRPDAGVL